MITSASTNPYDLASLAAAELASLTGVPAHDAVLVLGSGWVPAAELLGQATHDLPVTELPGFNAPSVAGHSGRVRSIVAGDKRLLVFLGRTHLYEGRGVGPVVLPAIVYSPPNGPP